MGDLTGFFNSWEPLPTYARAPQSAELAQRISKLAQFASRNGPSFVDLAKGRQQNNPEYSFLYGGEGADYWSWVLYCTILGLSPETPAPAPDATAYQQAYAQHPDAQQYTPQPPPAAAQAYVAPLPPDVDAAFTQVLDGLTGSKESIKTSKEWFIKCGADKAAGLAQRMAAYAAAQSTYPRLLHLIYLANDVLLKAASDGEGDGAAPGTDPISLAFLPVLPGMLSGAFAKGGSTPEVATRLTTILDFWGERKVYDAASIVHLKQSLRQPPVSPQPVASHPPALSPHLHPHSMPAPQAQPPLHAATSWGPQPQMGAPMGQGPAAAYMPQQAMPVAYGYAPPDIAQAAWQQPHAHYPGAHMGPPGAHMGPPGAHMPMAGMTPGPMWAAPPHGMGPPMGMDMQYNSMQPPGWFGGVPGAPVPPNLAHALHYPPPPVPPAGPPPVAEPPPTDPLSFPPGLIPALVKDKLEVDEPYSPLSTLDLERVSLPPATAPDAYLASRLDKFYAELQDYRAGMSRAEEEEKQKRAARLSGDAPALPAREHAGSFDPPSKSKRGGDGSFPSGGGRSGQKSGPAGLGFSSAGAGASSRDGEEPRMEDVYNSYRAGRSSAYKDAMARAQAAQQAL